MSFGEVEYKIIKKLLGGVELTDEENLRADQMYWTLEQNEQHSTKEHRRSHQHRMPIKPDLESEQFEEQEQFSS